VLAIVASAGLARLLNLLFVFDPGVMLLALMFSAAIGILFGHVPARKAARLDSSMRFATTEARASVGNEHAMEIMKAVAGARHRLGWAGGTDCCACRLLGCRSINRPTSEELVQASSIGHAGETEWIARWLVFPRPQEGNRR
jgi:hypothetical protein